jgi:hypothetical protein
MTAATRHNSPGSNSGTVACRDRHRSLPINKRTAPPRHPAVPTPRPTPPALLASSRGGHSARSGPGIAATSAPTSHALGVVCLWYDNRRQDDRIMAYYPVHHTAMLGEQPGNGCTAVRDSGTLSGVSVEASRRRRCGHRAFCGRWNPRANAPRHRQVFGRALCLSITSRHGHRP